MSSTTSTRSPCTSCVLTLSRTTSDGQVISRVCELVVVVVRGQSLHPTSHSKMVDPKGELSSKEQGLAVNAHTEEEGEDKDIDDGEDQGDDVDVVEVEAGMLVTSPGRCCIRSTSSDASSAPFPTSSCSTARLVLVVVVGVPS